MTNSLSVILIGFSGYYFGKNGVCKGASDGPSKLVRVLPFPRYIYLFHNVLTNRKV